VRAARELFAERGYGAVGTEEIVERAGVTRGALYHHFADKKDLFRAVYDQTEKEVVESIVSRAGGIEDPLDLLVSGVQSFLDVCLDPKLTRIGVLDAPVVLGWAEWREVGARHALGLVSLSLQAGMDAGVLRRAEVRPLAHLVLGALGEAAMLIANAENPRAARKEVEPALFDLLAGLQA
jgi:AcrR family transcriptional regulator